MRKLFLIPFIFLSPLIAHGESPAQKAWSEAQVLRLWEDPAWEKLLHFHRDILFRKRSSITDPVFFASKKGKKNPKAEMKAFIEGFFEVAASADDAMDCRFPARSEFIRRRLSSDLFPEKGACPRLESWKEKLSPAGVSMVFSSYYFNNPASMYGHTFLKLKRKGYEGGRGLLDYTVNYAAVTNTSNGVLFAVKGLLGGYDGAFSTEPFYVKVQQYNNLESRDIWEYELNFSSAAVERLVDHLWELGPVRVPYFFFNKNCSYQLLPLLEAAEPTLDLASQFRYRAIPLDTLRETLEWPGLKGKTIYHPSHAQGMIFRRNYLSPAQRDLALSWATVEEEEDPPSIDEFSLLEKRRILTSAHDYYRFKYGFYRDKETKEKKKEERILAALQEIPSSVSEDALEPLGLEPPELGHKTGLISFSYGADKQNSFEELTIRSALNDLSANPVGYVAGSELEMIKFRIRHDNQRGQTYLQEFTPIRIASLAPFDPWVHPPSWTVSATVEPARDLEGDPENNYQYLLRGGSGWTVQPKLFNGPFVYAMWMAEAAGGKTFRDGYRAGLGGQGGVILPMTDWLRFNFWGSWVRFPAGQPGNRAWLKSTLAMDLSKNIEGRFYWERVNHHQEGRVEAILYW